MQSQKHLHTDFHHVEMGVVLRIYVIWSCHSHPLAPKAHALEVEHVSYKNLSFIADAMQVRDAAQQNSLGPYFCNMVYLAEIGTIDSEGFDNVSFEFHFHSSASPS